MSIYGEKGYSPLIRASDKLLLPEIVSNSEVLGTDVGHTLTPPKPPTVFLHQIHIYRSKSRHQQFYRYTPLRTQSWNISLPVCRSYQFHRCNFHMDSLMVMEQFYLSLDFRRKNARCKLYKRALELQ